MMLEMTILMLRQCWGEAAASAPVGSRICAISGVNLNILNLQIIFKQPEFMH